MVARDGQGRNGGIGMASLETLRKKVGRNDEKMILLIGKRMGLISAVGRKKKALGLPLRDAAVERAVIRNAKLAGRKAGVGPRVVVRVMEAVMAESRRRQKKIFPRTHKGS
jgi:chorismate mutase